MTQVGDPIKTITVQPLKSPVPEKKPAPAPMPEPEKVPA